MVLVSQCDESRVAEEACRSLSNRRSCLKETRAKPVVSYLAKICSGELGLLVVISG